MDEQAQFNEVLNEVRELLPLEVIRTCEGLNGHGEWELALSHCQYYLKDKTLQIRPHVLDLISACEKRFKNGGGNK